ncbi:unnamed protein product, partial [Medioppia subpectinata]
MNRVFKTNVLKTWMRQMQTTCMTRQELPSLESIDPSGDAVVDAVTDKIYEDSLRHEDFFGVNKLFTVRQLFESRAHFGH